MLPEPYRLHHRADFSRTVRRGRRVGRRDIVVHVVVPSASAEMRSDDAVSSDDAAAPSLARFGGPRFGLIVSKAVGTAVVRHRVARRLRHICAGVVAGLPVEADVVIRALPGAAVATSAELDQQLRSALRKLSFDLSAARVASSDAP
ncbi:ribonuclease P protein component [Nocardia nova]|uniref:Ribonuclease P protein component n=1 Tax=Nocardia nova TaxID=37330 RepID=A0A2S6AV64_9NOCA|nr:ribonuclease P protein component [Nocardia nova]PPJ32411.1 ribonuclease P protein component [Nocardia nova]PPJ39078.1 ribonuclease P protein component [Nocardia nova]